MLSIDFTEIVLFQTLRFFYFLDMSLMENFSFDNDPMNEVFQMDTVHESTNGHNDRIPTVQGKKQTNYLLISRKMFFKTRIYLFFLFISTEDQSVEEDTPHFNVEITPPQTSEPEGATCLPDVVP